MLRLINFLSDYKLVINILHLETLKKHVNYELYNSNGEKRSRTCT